MDFENNEKKQEEPTQQEDFQRELKPGRSPRPRIHTGQRPNFERPSYRNHDNDEGGFRPEGFGAGLQGSAPQRGGYRPRNNYGQRPQGEGGYQPRQGGYQPRQGYGQRPQGEGGYQPRNNYGQRPQGGYQPRNNYGQRPQGEGGYQPRNNYGQRPQGGYQQRQGYGQRPQQGGFGKPYGAPYK